MDNLEVRFRGIIREDDYDWIIEHTIISITILDIDEDIEKFIKVNYPDAKLINYTVFEIK